MGELGCPDPEVWKRMPELIQELMLNAQFLMLNETEG